MASGRNPIPTGTMMKLRFTDLWQQPRGRLWTGVALGALLLVTVLYLLPSDASSGRAWEHLPTATVEQGPLTISLTESGTIRPREQIVLRSEIEGSTTILQIVDEGTLVRQGDLLVELDIADLENNVVDRRIRVQNDEADLIHAQENLKVVENQAAANSEQAQLNLQFARQDLENYIEGEYPKRIKEAETRITLAEEDLSRARESLKWSRILFDEKYLSQSELQQDELAEKRAQFNLELARADLDLLRDYTYRRELDQLESDVRQAELALEREQRMASANLAQARAQLAAREASLREELDRLRRLELQIEKARIYAPIDGMVLYASSVRNRWRGDPIEAGTTVRERDEIIYLPTASEFNIDVKITEVDLNKIRPGLPVRVTVDANPGTTFSGRVSRIAQLPDADSRWLNPNLKLYETVIELAPSEVELRNGMSCRAEITIERYDDVLFVPIQSVVRVNDQPTVYTLPAAGPPIPQPVAMGLDNGRFVHILNGLEPGDRILLAPPLTGSDDTRRPADDPFEDDDDDETEDTLPFPADDTFESTILSEEDT
jgi:HlyD family secretion protein